MNFGVRLSDAKKAFFDAKKVQAAADRAALRNLSKFGAHVRTRAMSSMLGHPVTRGFGAKSNVTNRAGTSAPGQPPTPHTGLLVRFILFGYDPTVQSVVIGPTLPRPDLKGARVLEEGGDETLTDRRGITRTAHYHAFPYMGPAYHTELGQLDPLFRDSIR